MALYAVSYAKVLVMVPLGVSPHVVWPPSVAEVSRKYFPYNCTHFGMKVIPVKYFIPCSMLPSVMIDGSKVEFWGTERSLIMSACMVRYMSILMCSISSASTERISTKCPLARQRSASSSKAAIKTLFIATSESNAFSRARRTRSCVMSTVAHCSSISRHRLLGSGALFRKM